MDNLNELIRKIAGKSQQIEKGKSFGILIIQYLTETLNPVLNEEETAITEFVGTGEYKEKDNPLGLRIYQYASEEEENRMWSLMSEAEKACGADHVILLKEPISVEELTKLVESR